MKKTCTLVFTFVVLFTTFSHAQDYKTAAGVQLDFGDGSTLVGPSVKYFFKDNHAVEGEVLFGTGITFLQAFYQYHKSIDNAKGLQWYVGAGPSLGLTSGTSSFYIRPMAGLDYKLNDIPLALSFDWRPFLYLGSNSFGSRFTAARFGIGIKYVIN